MNRIQSEQNAYELGYQQGAIEELEKIKAEIEDKILLNQTVAIQILDNHIAELKGEQDNEDRVN